MLPVPAKSTHFMQQMEEDSLPRLAIQYFQEEVLGRSPLTLLIRKRDLERFFRFYQELNGHLSVTGLAVRDVKLFLTELQRKGAAPNSINRSLSSVRAFGGWLLSQGYVRLHPCKGIRDLRVDLGPPKAPRDREYFRILKTAQTLADANETTVNQSFRDLVIIEALNATGLRVSELLSLTIPQFKGKKFLNVLCKGGRVRSVTMKSTVAELITEYIESHRVGGSDFLFTSKTGKQLDRVTAWKKLTRIAMLASTLFPRDEAIRLTPHCLRHRHAYQCRKAKDPVFAASRLGHSSLTYIQRYSQETAAEERELIENID